MCHGTVAASASSSSLSSPSSPRDAVRHVEAWLHELRGRNYGLNGLQVGANAHLEDASKPVEAEVTDRPVDEAGGTVQGKQEEEESPGAEAAADGKDAGGDGSSAEGSVPSHDSDDGSASTTAATAMSPVGGTRVVKGGAGGDGAGGKTVEEAVRPLHRWMHEFRRRAFGIGQHAAAGGSSGHGSDAPRELYRDKSLSYKGIMSQLQNAMEGDPHLPQRCDCGAPPPCCTGAAPPPRPSCCPALAPCSCPGGSSNSSSSSSSSASSSSSSAPSSSASADEPQHNECHCKHYDDCSAPPCARPHCACELLKPPPAELGGGSSDLIRDIEPPLPGAKAPAAGPTPAELAAEAAAKSKAAKEQAAAAAAAAVAKAAPQSLTTFSPANSEPFALDPGARAAADSAKKAAPSGAAGVTGAGTGKEPWLEGSDSSSSSSSSSGAAAVQPLAAAPDDDADKTDEGGPAAGPAADAAAGGAADAPGDDSKKHITINVQVVKASESSSEESSSSDGMDLESTDGEVKDEADAREAQYDEKAQQKEANKARSAEVAQKANRVRKHYCVGRTKRGELRMLLREARDGDDKNKACAAAFAGATEFQAYGDLWGYSESVEGTSPLCVRSATDASWRSELVWGSSCVGPRWRQDFVMYVRRGAMPGSTPFCVKSSTDPRRAERQYVDVGSTSCDSQYWRQRLVFWAYPSEAAAGVAVPDGDAAAAAGGESSEDESSSSDESSAAAPTPITSFREVMRDDDDEDDGVGTEVPLADDRARAAGPARRREAAHRADRDSASWARLTQGLP